MWFFCFFTLPRLGALFFHKTWKKSFNYFTFSSLLFSSNWLHRGPSTFPPPQSQAQVLSASPALFQEQILLCKSPFLYQVFPIGRRDGADLKDVCKYSTALSSISDLEQIFIILVKSGVPFTLNTVIHYHYTRDDSSQEMFWWGQQAVVSPALLERISIIQQRAVTAVRISQIFILVFPDEPTNTSRCALFFRFSILFFCFLHSSGLK